MSFVCLHSLTGARTQAGGSASTLRTIDTCMNCGSGHNIKLDDAMASDRPKCPCQQDSIKIAVDAARWNGRLTYPRNALPQKTPLDLPKRLTYDNNKLISSVYAKAAQSSSKRDGKYVLKYQQDNQQHSAGQRSPSQTFPKLISRYCSKPSNDAMSTDPVVCIDTYQQNSQLSVINQSLQ